MDSLITARNNSIGVVGVAPVWIADGDNIEPAAPFVNISAQAFDFRTKDGSKQNTDRTDATDSHG